MRKIIIFLSIFVMLSTQASAFLYELKILSAEEITQLSDEQLMDVYVEAKIEERASGEFHYGAGFNSAKEYNKRKELLRYIFELRREMGKRRKIKTDSIDSYLK